MDRRWQLDRLLFIAAAFAVPAQRAAAACADIRRAGGRGKAEAQTKTGAKAGRREAARRS